VILFIRAIKNIKKEERKMFKKEFIEIIRKEVSKVGHEFHKDTVIINFRDKSYSPKMGGFHPVEVMLEEAEVLYVTDFCYFGQFNEMVKDLDWDFALGRFQQLGLGESREYPISEGYQLFQVWQSNFVSYYRMSAYDEIDVEMC